MVPGDESIQDCSTVSLLRQNKISIGCVAIDKKLLRDARFDPTYNLLGDFDLWVRLSMIHPINCVPGPLELSRQHSTNFSKIVADSWITERRYFYKKIFGLSKLQSLPSLALYIVKTEIKGLIGRV